MNSSTPVIQIENLSYAYGRAEAVHHLSLTVEPGRCYGLFGRNGAGKSTTMKCLLNLLRPQRGQVRVFGLDPARQEVAVKRLLSYVPDVVAFYPWMSVRETLDYLASFRAHWNRKIEQELLERFQLDPAQRTAICPGASGRKWRWSPRAARRRTCWCSMNRRRAWTPSCAANSSRR